MITKVVFPGIDTSKIDDEIDYIDKDVSLPIYSAHNRQELDPKDISTIVGKLTKIYRNGKGGYSADIETYSRVLDEFRCEMIYAQGIWLAVLADADVPAYKKPVHPTQQQPSASLHGVQYQKAKQFTQEELKQAMQEQKIKEAEVVTGCDDKLETINE